jgi:hypothetical protein
MVPKYSQQREIMVLRLAIQQAKLDLQLETRPAWRKVYKGLIYDYTEALLRYAVAEPVTNA